ncbi:hypothetical protein C8R46DRAFT_1137411, partial [Mycena filopes]
RVFTLWRLFLTDGAGVSGFKVHIREHSTVHRNFTSPHHFFSKNSSMRAFSPLRLVFPILILLGITHSVNDDSPRRWHVRDEPGAVRPQRAVHRRRGRVLQLRLRHRDRGLEERAPLRLGLSRHSRLQKRPARRRLVLLLLSRHVSWDPHGRQLPLRRRCIVVMVVVRLMAMAPLAAPAADERIGLRTVLVRLLEPVRHAPVLVRLIPRRERLRRRNAEGRHRPVVVRVRIGPVVRNRRGPAPHGARRIHHRARFLQRRGGKQKLFDGQSRLENNFGTQQDVFGLDDPAAPPSQRAINTTM